MARSKIQKKKSCIKQLKSRGSSVASAHRICTASVYKKKRK